MPDNPSILDYRGKPPPPRRPPIRFSYPRDLFTLLRTAMICLTVLAFFGPSFGFRFIYVWYIDISTHVALMRLHPNYAPQLPSFPFFGPRPDVIDTILTYPHWPYAHWITIPRWLAIPLWIVALILLWRLTRYPGRPVAS
jgi:hypothetical protein